MVQPRRYGPAVVYSMCMQTYPYEVENAIIHSQDTYVWEAPSFEHGERGPRWYVFMAVTVAILMAYAVWTANFLFAFIVMLSAIIILLAGNQAPKPMLVQVGENGIVHDGKLILYQDIDNFAIIYQPPISKVLYVERRSAIRPRLAIPLQEQDPVALREHLKRYIREDLDLQGEHLSDTIARLLKI